MSSAIYISTIILTLLIMLTANIYIPYRLSILLNASHPKIITATFFVTTLIGMFSMGGIARLNEGVLLVIARVGLIWLGFALFLLMYLLIFEATNLFFKLPRHASGISIIVLALLTTAYSIYNARDYRIKEITIQIDNLSKELTIFHIPDIHLGAFRGREELEQIVADINRLQPDITLINGDLVDGMNGINPDTLRPLQQIETPVFYTGGNHEAYVSSDEVERLVEIYGVDVLGNEMIEIGGIQLLGLEHMRADDSTFDIHAEENGSTIKSELERIKTNREKPMIVAHHSPNGMEHMHNAGADLVLAGHTHAGQIFPASLIARLQFDYMKGLYNYKDTQLYVTQGVGTFGPPMRFGTEGEATLIRLINAD